jgi:hypothetical protein
MGKAMHYLFSMAIGMAITAVALTGQGREGRQGGQPARVGPEAPPIGFFGSYRNMEDKKDPSKLPIIGAWRVNFERSDPSYKAAGRFKATGTTIYTAMDGGIKTETFLFYPPKDDSYKTTFTDDGRQYWFKLDGKDYKDPQGPNGLGQTVRMWLVDKNTLYRERTTKGVVDERVLYRVSPDGKTLTWTNFANVNGDSGHQVWDRVQLPARATR